MVVIVVVVVEHTIFFLINNYCCCRPGADGPLLFVFLKSFFFLLVFSETFPRGGFVVVPLLLGIREIIATDVRKCQEGAARHA